ncbi:MAG: TIGR02710 family CRISPR-associated CARF protein [Nitrospira sp.]|nr:TIGR02710 family CRISPR-associated CARF protein [Nitrospira sp.]
MAQEQPVQALVVALTKEVASAVYSLNRLRPDAACFVLPESAKPLVEHDLQPRLSQIPRRWDWIVVPDVESFPACYVTIARSLPTLLETWGVEPGTLVVDLSGATTAMAAGLTLAAMPHASRVVSIIGAHEGRDGETVTLDGIERQWVQANPWDEAARGMRREGCALFNRGAMTAAAVIFRQIEHRVSGGLKPLYRALVDLADGYDLWERFQHRQAWEKLKASIKALEMATLFGGPAEVKACLPAIKANSGFLEKLVLDPAEVKEALALDLLAHAGRRLRVAQDPEAAMQSLLRALEAFAQRQLFKQYRIRTWDLQPEQLPEALRHICRTCYLEDIDGKYKLPLQAQFRALAGLGDQSGQAFLKEWPAMKPLLDAANHAVLGHGFEAVKAERVQQLYEAVIKLAGVAESSLPQFPKLHLP